MNNKDFIAVCLKPMNNLMAIPKRSVLKIEALKPSGTKIILKQRKPDGSRITLESILPFPKVKALLTTHL